MSIPTRYIASFHSIKGFNVTIPIVQKCFMQFFSTFFLWNFIYLCANEVKSQQVYCLLDWPLKRVIQHAYFCISSQYAHAFRVQQCQHFPEGRALVFSIFIELPVSNLSWDTEIVGPFSPSRRVYVAHTSPVGQGRGTRGQHKILLIWTTKIEIWGNVHNHVFQNILIN